MGMIGAFQELTREDTIAVGTSSSVIAPVRFPTNERKVLLVRNSSPNVADIIYIAYGDKQAVSGSGIQLKQGESFTESNGEGYKAFQGQINAVCDTANGVLTIFER